MKDKRLVCPNTPSEALISFILQRQGSALLLPSPVKQRNTGIVIFNILEKFEQVFSPLFKEFLQAKSKIQAGREGSGCPSVRNRIQTARSSNASQAHPNKCNAAPTRALYYKALALLKFQICSWFACCVQLRWLKWFSGGV